MAALAAIRTYRYVRHHVIHGLGDLFVREALDLFEKGQLDRLISYCRERLLERPNHVYRALLLSHHRQNDPRWTRRVVVDHVGGGDEAGLTADGAAGVRVAIDVREEAARDVDPDVVAAAKPVRTNG